MTPLYIFDLDGTLALIDHRRHFVDGGPCFWCKGLGAVKRHPTEVQPDPVVDRFGQPVYLPVMDECPTCKGAKNRTKDWKAFFAACVDDQPNWPVISVLNTLLSSGADIRIWSGRSAEVMNETLAWLQRYVTGPDYEEIELCMRREGDYTPDEQLKKLWLDELNEYDRKRLVCVFDDRQKVVDMWRANGVACFQVAPGEF